LDRRVDARLELHLLAAAVGALDDGDELLARPEIVAEPGQGDDLAAVEPEALRALPFEELEGHDAHADEVRAVDALEAAGDHGLHAEEIRALGGPVARAAHAVVDPGEDDERHAAALVLHAGVE